MHKQETASSRYYAYAKLPSRHEAEILSCLSKTSFRYRAGVHNIIRLIYHNGIKMLQSVLFYNRRQD